MTTSGTILVAAHAWYGDVIGGSFRLASEFAADLAADGCDVAYVCCAPANRPDLPRVEMSGGVALHRYPPAPAGTGPLARMRHHVRQTREIVAQLGRSRRIVAVSGHSPLQFRGAVPALPRGTAFRNYTVHSPFDDELATNVETGSTLRAALRWPAVRAARAIDRRNCAVADRVQCDSQYTLDTLRRKHPRQIGDKGCVAPGWVDCATFSSAGDRRAARQTLGPLWQTDTPVFFTLRRLESRMGLDTLIEAAALVRSRGHDLRVLIGGGGALRDALSQLIRERQLEDHVRLLGRVPEHELAACYAAADCFVLPTRALECFGLIVLEAFAAGTPVIASRAAAIPEIASRQGAGWDFEPGDRAQLADRMEAFLTSRLKTAADLRAIARQFDRPRVYPQWRELLLAVPRAETVGSVPPLSGASH